MGGGEKKKGNKNEKRNGEWSTWVVGKRKKGIKRKKEMGSGVHGWWGKEKRNGEWSLRVWWKKRGVEKKEEKKFEREKTKLVLFVCSLCLVQSIKL
jgi:hypothetical protein